MAKIYLTVAMDIVILDCCYGYGYTCMLLWLSYTALDMVIIIHVCCFGY